MQGQAHNVDDLGAPHLALGDLGDDLVAHFYKWKAAAEKNDGSLPFFSKWTSDMGFEAAVTENQMSQDSTFSVVDDKEHIDGKQVGTFGILKSYSQASPTDLYPPVNYKMYLPLLRLDQAFRRDAPGNEAWENEGDGRIAPLVFLASTATASVAVAAQAKDALIEGMNVGTTLLLGQSDWHDIMSMFT